MTLDIGTRMKSYEQNRRLAKGAVIIRADGRAFHTWVKKIDAVKPFDPEVMSCMRVAMEATAQEMAGFRLGYTQSDEASFLLVAEDEKSELWFGGKLDKIISLASSMFTYHFNEYGWEHPGFFDARAFNIPVEDAANYFYWRQMDWIRNSVTMLGRAHFSHKEMLGKSRNEVKAMLAEKGVSWDDLGRDKKYGTFLIGDAMLSSKMDYELINELAGINVTN